MICYRVTSLRIVCSAVWIYVVFARIDQTRTAARLQPQGAPYDRHKHHKQHSQQPKKVPRNNYFTHLYVGLVLSLFGHVARNSQHQYGSFARYIGPDADLFMEEALVCGIEGHHDQHPLAPASACRSRFIPFTLSAHYS